MQFCFLRTNSSSEGIFYRMWLFKNLFEHKMVIPTFINFTNIKTQLLNCRSRIFILQSFQYELFLTNNCYIPIIQVYYTFGIFYYRCCIRSQKIFFISNTYYKRATSPCGNQFILFISTHDNKSVGSDYF
ncbi:hypothetical protein ES705_43640 [subsurface metagenome]